MPRSSTGAKSHTVRSLRGGIRLQRIANFQEDRARRAAWASRLRVYALAFCSASRAQGRRRSLICTGPDDVSLSVSASLRFQTKRLPSRVTFPRGAPCRSLTPAPPPFSAMNSTPAASRAAIIFCVVAVRPPSTPSSASSLLTVGIETPEASAICSCDHATNARAALICLIDTFSIDNCRLPN